MPATKAQKIVALLANLTVTVCLTFGMSLVIMWLIAYLPGERSHWYGLVYVAIFGLVSGFGLTMWVVTPFESRFERIYMLSIVMSMCGGWLFGAHTGVDWWHSVRAAELSPYVMLVSVFVSMIGCAILHRFRPDIIPFNSGR